jgi:hypothetical protein
MGKILVRCRNSELSVDDLRTWQGVVLGLTFDVNNNKESGLSDDDSNLSVLNLIVH